MCNSRNSLGPYNFAVAFDCGLWSIPLCILLRQYERFFLALVSFAKTVDLSPHIYVWSEDWNYDVFEFGHVNGVFFCGVNE